MQNKGLEQNDIDYLESFLKENKTKLSEYDQASLLGIYRRTINKDHKPGTCASCWKKIIKQLKQMYNKQTKWE